MLTEQQIMRAWRRLFREDTGLDQEAFDEAEALLSKLRPESPLRHRLAAEVELRRRVGTASVQSVSYEGPHLSVLVDDDVDASAFAEFLGELSAVYCDLSGDELIIRDGRIPAGRAVLP